MKTKAQPEPELSQNMSDWKMPMLSLRACSGNANFLLALIEESLGKSRELLKIFWKRPTVQEEALKHLIRLHYATSSMREFVTADKTIMGFFGYPELIIMNEANKTLRIQTAKHLSAIAESGHNLLFHCLARPEWILRDDDDKRSRHKIRQDSIDKNVLRLERHYSELKAMLLQLAPKKPMVASPSKG